MHATNRHRHKRRIGSDTGAQKGTICGATTQSARKSITSTKVVPGNSKMERVGGRKCVLGGIRWRLMSSFNDGAVFRLHFAAVEVDGCI